MSESTVTVKANQATTDWQDGAIFSVERTEYVDKLLENGVLSIYIPDGEPLFVGKDVVLGERYDLDATPLTDNDAKAAGFDLDNPDALPPAFQTVGDDADQADGHTAGVHPVTGDTVEAVSSGGVVYGGQDTAEPVAADEKPSESKPRPKRGTAKKSDYVGE